MYLTLSLLAAVIVTVLVVSKIAKMLLAKRFQLEWIVLASVVSAVIAVVTYVGLNLFVVGLEPMVMLGITFGAMLLISSAAFKYINQMGWGAAIATNVANVVIILATSVAAIVLNGESLTKTISSLTDSAKNNTAMVGSMVNDNGIANIATPVESPEMNLPEEVLDDDGIEPMVTELDLLPKGTIKALEKNKKRVYVEPKFHVISIDSIRSLVGKSLRVHKKNGSTIIGYLQSVDGNDAVLNQRISGGTAITPISFSSIKKLEVYR
ncbi:MAG: hypothetical protein V3V19_03590 [Cocleimonas sp.]